MTPVMDETMTRTRLWLDTMREEIDSANTTEFQPHDKIKPNETSIGMVPQPLQKIWALGQSYMKNCERLTHEMRWERDENKVKLLGGQCQESHAIAETLLNIFWLEVRRHYDLFATDDAVGIRQGWEAVTFHEQNPMEMLSAILGHRPRAGHNERKDMN